MIFLIKHCLLFSNEIESLLLLRIPRFCRFSMASSSQKCSSTFDNALDVLFSPSDGFRDVINVHQCMAVEKWRELHLTEFVYDVWRYHNGIVEFDGFCMFLLRRWKQKMDARVVLKCGWTIIKIINLSNTLLFNQFKISVFWKDF